MWTCRGGLLPPPVANFPAGCNAEWQKMLVSIPFCRMLRFFSSSKMGVSSEAGQKGVARAEPWPTVDAFLRGHLAIGGIQAPLTMALFVRRQVYEPYPEPLTPKTQPAIAAIRRYSGHVLLCHVDYSFLFLVSHFLSLAFSFLGLLSCTERRNPIPAGFAAGSIRQSLVSQRTPVNPAR
jgi:hypothetical protein